MKASEKMTTHVQVVSPEDTIQTAAAHMATAKVGALPVAENELLIGMISDRDITIRAVAAGRGLDTKVRDVMTAGLHYCFDDEDIKDVARTMGENQVRRLPVMNREKRLVGILSLGDLASGARLAPAGVALASVSRPSRAH